MKAVVITGASTGIGKATALRLSQAGLTVFAGVRKEADAEALKREMKVTPVLLDVTNETHINNAVEAVQKTVGTSGLYGLVNNAGVVVSGPLEFLQLSHLRRQFEVNVFAQFAVTQAFLPLLRQATGRIVMMSSISGKFASPLVGPYAGSKFALEGLSDALRRELSPWKLHVSIIEPGFVKTPIWEKSIAAAETLAHDLPSEAHTLYGTEMNKLRGQASLANDQGVSADEVAKAVEHALVSVKPKTRYLVGADAKRAALLLSLLPDAWMDWLTKRTA